MKYYKEKHQPDSWKNINSDKKNEKREVGEKGGEESKEGEEEGEKSGGSSYEKILKNFVFYAFCLKSLHLFWTIHAGPLHLWGWCSTFRIVLKGKTSHFVCK